MSAVTRKVRHVVRERSGGRCEVCGNGVGIGGQQHHRRPRGMGSSIAPGTNLPSNLLMLCTACHLHIESRRTWAYRQGYLVHQGHDPATVLVWLWDGRCVYLTHDGGYAAPVPSREVSA